jgi:hypothetical protein
MSHLSYMFSLRSEKNVSTLHVLLNFSTPTINQKVLDIVKEIFRLKGSFPLKMEFKNSVSKLRMSFIGVNGDQSALIGEKIRNCIRNAKKGLKSDRPSFDSKHRANKSNRVRLSTQRFRGNSLDAWTQGWN